MFLDISIFFIIFLHYDIRVFSNAKFTHIGVFQGFQCIPGIRMRDSLEFQLSVWPKYLTTKLSFFAEENEILLKLWTVKFLSLVLFHVSLIN